MKKLVLSVLTVLSCGVVYALPISNPTEASLYTNGVWWGRSCIDICDPCFTWLDAFSIRIGFYGDYVFNRNLQANNNTSNTGSCVDTTTLFTNAGTITLNICDWIDIYGVVGATHLELSTNETLFQIGSTGAVAPTYISAANVDFNSAFSWSVGGRATLWECGCFGVGVEGQYFRTATTLNSFSDSLGYNYLNSDATYSEWQAGLGASYRFVTGCPGSSLVPYIGVKWAGSKLTMTNLTFTSPSGRIYSLRNLYNSRLWGYAVGLTAMVNNMFGVTVEGRWGDESAVYVDSQLRF